MRTTADDDDKANEGSSSSTSCVVDSKIEKETNEPVGVNNCVNINSNSFADASKLISDIVIDNAPLSECIAAELDDDGAMVLCDEVAQKKKIEEEILNKFLFNDDDDDDTLTSSKYSDVTSRCEMLQPSTSRTTVVNDVDVVVSSHYKSTRDNNRNHRKAVRKNFSLWIGVTSCVWGLLLLLMKNYVD
jgi:hypothetical protein